MPMTKLYGIFVSEKAPRGISAARHWNHEISLTDKDDALFEVADYLDRGFAVKIVKLWGAETPAIHATLAKLNGAHTAERRT